MVNISSKFEKMRVSFMDDFFQTLCILKNTFLCINGAIASEVVRLFFS